MGETIFSTASSTQEIKIVIESKVRSWVCDSADNCALVTTKAELNDGNWHHLAMTYTGSTRTVQVYLDGVSQGTSKNSKLSGRLYGSDVTVGGAGLGFFNGDIDDLRIWNVVRTEQEIQDNMNVENPT